MKWFRNLSLAAFTSLGMASVVSAGLFGGSSCSNQTSCAATSNCIKPPACATATCSTSSCTTAPRKKSNLFSCLFGKKQTTCASTCAPKPVCAPVRKPVCTTPVSCAPQPKKRGLFDCFKSKKSSCGAGCAPTSVCSPVRKPVCTTPVCCAPQPKKAAACSIASKARNLLAVPVVLPPRCVLRFASRFARLP